MKPLPQRGVFDMRGLVWTESRVPGRKIYGEPRRPFKGKEYRGWSPYRSKMAALLRKDAKTPWLDPSQDVLYLGASSGTTVSHVSDLLRPGAKCIAVEFSARSVRDLLWNMEGRTNVVPVMADAGAPAAYAAYLDRPVGALVQDVAQRHQVDIFLRNIHYLADDGIGMLFVKARSIHVADPPKTIYAAVERRLRDAGLRIERQVDLDPFEKDHRAFIVRKP